MRHDVLLVLFTDLDGTLLDHETGSPAAAADALHLIARAGVPLVCCSSKTRAEIEWVRRELGIRDPFISENGGALYVPVGYFPFRPLGSIREGEYDVIEFGRPYADLVVTLHRVAMRLGVKVRGFYEMTAEDIARECGLALPLARLAKQRQYDEPFCFVPGGDGVGSMPLTPTWRDSIRRRLIVGLGDEGLRCTRGARFDHVTGPTDKGVAVARLRMLYEAAPEAATLITAGFGDSLNDVPLLRAVDIPVVVKNRRADTARLLRELALARVTEQSGPAGWSEAARDVVHGVLGDAPGCWR